MGASGLTERLPFTVAGAVAELAHMLRRTAFPFHPYVPRHVENHLKPTCLSSLSLSSRQLLGRKFAI